MPTCFLSGLQTWRFPTSNTYTDDAGCGGGAVYSNTSVLQHMVR